MNKIRVTGLLNHDSIPAKTFSTEQPDGAASDHHLPINSFLFPNTNMDIKLSLSVYAIHSQKRVTATGTPKVIPGPPSAPSSWAGHLEIQSHYVDTW